MSSCQEVEARWPHDNERLSELSIIEESFPKTVRMAILAIVGSHSVNGVAEIHTGLVRTRLFPQLAEMWPDKFNNKTNGVTPRRWLLLANPSLAALLTKWLGAPNWVTDTDRLRILKEQASNADLQQEWTQSKRVNKVRLAEYIQQHCGVEVRSRE
jgi:starch phosphorylase